MDAFATSRASLGTGVPVAATPRSNPVVPVGAAGCRNMNLVVVINGRTSLRKESSFISF
jgi:hypothetical protein